MGAAFFVILGLCVLVIVGFAIYGMFLGLGRLGSHVKRRWREAVALNERATLAGAVEESSGEELFHDRPERRCWEIKECLQGFNGSCPARQRPDVPCWLAIMQARGDYRIKPDCLVCKLFDIKELVARV